MPDIALTGCTPEPLMNYLKALGVFRLVAQQLPDAQARLAWRGGVAHLESKLDREALIEFFANEYHPTPILAPWNGGSGFYDGGKAPLEAIADSDSARLEDYRSAIRTARTLVPKTKPKNDEKNSLLIRCRRELADEVVPWLDVCFVLGEEGPKFFPLLGTGGNDGRLDFTNNFMQRLKDVVPFSDGKPPVESRSLLAAALFADELVSLGTTAIGQFNPGGIGGANGTQGKFEAGSQVNPWDYVLMIEGALLFAGSVARRLGTNGTNRGVFPFTVDSVAVGYGSATASEETTDGSRAELWLPLWKTPCRFAEIKQLFSEGRAQFGRRQAKNAVEFALAVNLLGISRGVTSFARYGFLKRNGLAFLATPLGRVEVKPRPAAELLKDPALFDWLDRLRRACSDKEKTPGRYQAALRQLDRAIFEFAARSELGNDAPYLQSILLALGKAERILSGGLRFVDDKRIRPLQGLSSDWWKVAAADDDVNNGGAEFRLAAALAGIEAERDVVPSLRAYLEPVERDGRYFKWSPGSTSAVWSNRSLADNLAAIFMRRKLEAFRNGRSDVPLKSLIDARPADVVTYLEGDVDEDRMTALLWALIGVERPIGDVAEPQPTPSEEWRVPFEFAVPRSVVKSIAVRGSGAGVYKTAPDPDVFPPLLSGRDGAVAEAVTRAARRLRSSGLTPIGYGHRAHGGSPLEVVSRIRPERLLAAMLFPLSDRDLRTIADRILSLPETKE